jgi:hypothetical protein
MFTTHQHAPFTVSTDSDGLNIFRHASAGLVRESSADGLRWSMEVIPWDEGPLHPICRTAPAASEVLVRNAGGRVLRVEPREGRLHLRGEVAMPILPEKWYETSPRPEDMTLVRDEAQGVYRLFFCARRAVGKDPLRRGCIGSAISEDLLHWETEPPIFAPNQYPELASPHVFGDGEHTALFYVARAPEGAESLRYAVAPRLAGPYERPEADLLANDARRSIVTVPFGPRSLAFFGRTEAGGSRLSVSRPGQLDFTASGRPFVRFFEGLLNLLGKPLFHTEASLESSELLVRVLPRYGGAFRLTARLLSKSASAVGLLFRTTMTGHDNITLWLDFASKAVTARRGVNGRLLARAPRTIVPGEEYRLAVWAEGPFADVYLDDEWVLSVETEGRATGGFGLAVLGGAARFEDVGAQAIEPK